jgi:hypothetical protein
MNDPADSYSPEEANARFEATIRGALKTPPIPHPSKKTTEAAQAPASAATARTVQPKSGNQASSGRR